MNKNHFLKAATFLSLTMTLTACTTTQPRDAFTMSGRMVNIGTHSLHLYCSGEGRPTVILESGAGIGSSEWQLVQGPLAEKSRVCSYDRAGLVWSERRRGNLTAEAVALDLHTLLSAAGETEPFLLVGHSLGGIYIREFAELYPDEVVGMVLVDSSHPDQEVTGMGIFGAPLIGSLSLALARTTGIARRNLKYALITAPLEVRELNQAYLNYSLPAIVKELNNVPDILAEVGGADSLGNTPLTVIAADLQYRPEYGLNFQVDPDQLAEQYRRHRELQEDLLALSSRSSFIVADKSGHNVPFEQPEIIIDAVSATLDAAR